MGMAGSGGLIDLASIFGDTTFEPSKIWIVHDWREFEHSPANNIISPFVFV